MMTKRINSVSPDHSPVRTVAKKRLDQRLLNTLVLFSKSELGEKILTVLARVLGFAAIIGSLAFAAWGIISTAM